ncbi:hypothetical protein EIP91_006840 [Steccherinum ochraceum]|uniref:Symplekin n=1 Tax=Steccherinum ochraceum TaxID=92696 RepID=A0A4R0RTA0_9APHY|nr:hypothetical protein EIP91_006840 [Steccherinum ochraceum]
MANEPVDPLQTLSQALACPPDSKEQAELLAALRESLEVNSNPIPILITTLFKIISGTGDTLLKRWVLELVHFAVSRSTLSLEARSQLAAQSLDLLVASLNYPNPWTVKVVIQCFGTVYPLLFRMLCTNRTQRHPWDILNGAKNRILDLVTAPQATAGMRLAAVKFMQRAILVQTRGINDPRLQNKNDPNLSMCPTDHPFMPVAVLEGEGVKMLESIITLLYTSTNPDLVTAIINSWSQLVKLRPALVELVISSLSSWTPASLASLPAAHIKSVEKAVRILLMHISRTPQGQPYTAQIQAALANQGARMDKAAADEKQRKANAAADLTRKRAPSSSATPTGPDAKRVKLEPNASSFLSTFDFSTLPATLVTELIVSNLQVFSDAALTELVQTYKANRETAQTAASTVAPVPTSPTAIVPPTLPADSTTPSTAPSRAKTPPPDAAQNAASLARTRSPPKAPAAMLDARIEIKDEPQDPLKMNVDEGEIEYEPDRLNAELSGGEQEAYAEVDYGMNEDTDITLDPREFKLPPPKFLDDDERNSLVRSSLVRIWDGAKDLTTQEVDLSETQGFSPTDMWMLLLVRLITRTADPPTPPAESEATEEPNGTVVSELYDRQDRLRQTLCDYVMADFGGRLRLATVWMNEEWYNDQIRTKADPEWRPSYETWLNQIVAVHQTHIDGKDRTFARFLLDLPAIPQDVLNLLREMCVEPERRQIGFTTLRDFVQQRPSLRAEAMTMLLELTTHADKITRGAAINTVKRWIDQQPMNGMIRDFALQLLRRLQSRPRKQETHVNGDGDTTMDDEEDGQLPAEDIIQTPYLPAQLELPTNDAAMLQHLELLFALSTKIPELLDELFAAYGGMDESVQATIQHLITPLVRALGQNHNKLLTLLRTFPPGSETLALRVLHIFTENGRPSHSIVSLVKTLVSERDLDARFLIPIIAEMDKADILRHLPRIVSMLNNTQEAKNTVRSVFNSIVTTPPQSFGSVTSNLPRSEKEIGLKSAIEAIGICFSMTDIFRSEILGVVMNLLVDAPVLPTLFMRTVIQAVTTYRSLVGFVSTTLMSRLITKKIWTVAPLWEGFIRCAKVTSPACLPSLLQLPKDQLQDLVNKQPSLKSGLRDYVTKKDGYKARLTGLLDILGDEEPAQAQAAPATPPSGEDSVMHTPPPVDTPTTSTPQPEVSTPS